MRWLTWNGLHEVCARNRSLTAITVNNKLY